MNQIKTISELEELLKVVEGKKPLTNCYLFGDELNSLISLGYLYYQISGFNLFLFKCRNEGDFFELYYYINEENLPIKIDQKAPIVLEIPYRGSPKFPQRELDYLMKCGFELHINRDLMFLNRPNLSQKEVSVINCSVKLFDDVSHTHLVFNSIKETFDFFTGDILSLEEVKQSIQNKEVLAIYSCDSLAGFLRYYIKNKVSWIGHIVIFDEFAGKGLGKLLVYEYLKHQFAKGIQTFQHWVVSDNNTALKLYDYFGFKKMNKSSISLIKK